MQLEEYIKKPLLIKNWLCTLFENGCNILFEVGACEGEDTVKYSRLFPKSKIFSFEPLPKNYLNAKTTLDKHDIKNVELFQIALSDSNGKADFYVSEGKPPHVSEDDEWDYGNKSSSLLEPDKHKEIYPFIRFEQIVTVETKTLDSFLFEHSISEIDFVHMDVQGAELKVLKGGKDSIKKIKAIWLEVADQTLYKNQPLRADIRRFMRENGFVNILSKNDDELYVNLHYYTPAQLKIIKIKSKIKDVFF